LGGFSIINHPFGGIPIDGTGHQPWQFKILKGLKIEDPSVWWRLFANDQVLGSAGNLSPSWTKKGYSWLQVVRHGGMGNERSKT
jgi:hypothetical protein